MQRYGQNAHLLNTLKNCLLSLLSKPPRLAVLLFSLALVIPATMIIFSNTFHTVQNNLLENRQISVFLNTRISSDDARAYASALADNEHIYSAVLTSETLRGRPVNSVTLKPSDELTQSDLETIIGELKSHAQVDFVDADPAWLAQSYDAMRTAKVMAAICYSLIVLSTIALVFWINYMDLKRQHAESQVLNQMGASYSTLLRPLTLRCLVLNLAAIIGASTLVWWVVKILTNLDVMSTYVQLLPRDFPIGRVILLTILAAISSIVIVRLLARKHIFSL